MAGSGRFPVIACSAERRGFYRRKRLLPINDNAGREKKRMTGGLRKKFIGDRKFYRMVLTVAVPIMIQNGITNFVGLLDNIMVGQIGTEQMSGVAIVNQLMMVY